MKQVAAIVMIGDGVVSMLCTREDAMVWAKGPRFWRKTIEWLADHPTMRRTMGAMEAAGGVLLALSGRED
jgi:hypothetical protein